MTTPRIDGVLQTLRAAAKTVWSNINAIWTKGSVRFLRTVIQHLRTSLSIIRRWWHQTLRPRCIAGSKRLQKPLGILLQSSYHHAIQGARWGIRWSRQYGHKAYKLWRHLLSCALLAWQHLRDTLAARLPELRRRAQQYALLIRLHKPIGCLLLLWPTLWALWIAAEGVPTGSILAVFLCGVFLMRSAGVVLNDIADRQYDGHVARTRSRPLVTGTVTPWEALGLACALLLLAFFLAALILNTLTLILAMVALVLASTYPFMKRYIWLPQFYLGLSFGWGIPMAFAALTGHVPLIAWVLLIANIFWTAAYDTIYAIMDRTDDQCIGIKSTAILFAEDDVTIVGLLLLLASGSLAIVAHNLQFGSEFYIALLCANGISLRQLWLIRKRQPERCLQAFLNSNHYGALIFIGIVMHYR